MNTQVNWKYAKYSLTKYPKYFSLTVHRNTVTTSVWHTIGSVSMLRHFAGELTAFIDLPRWNIEEIVLTR